MSQQHEDEIMQDDAVAEVVDDSAAAHRGNMAQETDHVKVWAATLVTFGAVVAIWTFMLPETFKNTVVKESTEAPVWNDFRQQVADQAAAFEQAMAVTDQRLSEAEAAQATEIRAQVAEDGAAALREKIEAAASAPAEGGVAGVAAETNVGTDTEPKLP